MAQLRSPTDYRRATPAGLDGESQTGVPADARGQSAVRTEAEVRRDHRFQPHPQGLSEPGGGSDPDRAQSALEGRYYLYPAARRVCVPGSDSGRLLASRNRLGPGSHDGRRVDFDGAPHGAFAPRRPCRAGPSFRSRLPVRQQRIHGSAESQRHRHQHVAQRQPVGQGLRFILHLLRTVDYVFWEATPFGELDALCLARRIRSGIFV